MQNKYLMFLFTFIIVFSVFSYSQSNKAYPFKSIEIEFKTESSAFGTVTKGTKTVWIDNYGDKEATLINEKTTTKVMGMESSEVKNTLNIRNGNTGYSVDLIEKTATKTDIGNLKLLAFAFGGKIDVKSKDPRKNLKDFVEKNNGKWYGSDSFLGKSCDVFSLMGVKMWMYKNVVLKSESEISGVVSSEIAISIKEDITIPTNKFEVPKGITIQETTLDFQNYDEVGETESTSGSTLPYSKFENSMKKIKVTDYSLQLSNSDDNEYSAMFMSSAGQILMIVTQDISVYNEIKKGNPDYELKKSLKINGKNAMLVKVLNDGEGEEVDKEGLFIEYKEYNMTLLITSSNMNQEQLESVAKQIKF